MAPMKSGVKARDLRHVRQALEDCFNGCQIMRLVQRSKRDEFAQLFENFPCHNDGLGVLCSPMNHSVANTEDPRTTVFRAEPACQRIQRATAILNGRIQLLISQAGALRVLGRESGRSSDAFDLSVRFQMPIFELWPPVDTEL